MKNAIINVVINVIIILQKSALFFLFLEGFGHNKMIFRTELMTYVHNIWIHSVLRILNFFPVYTALIVFRSEI